jgi:fumarate hydratase class II
MHQSLMLVTALNPHIGNYIYRLIKVIRRQMFIKINYNKYAQFYVTGYDKAAAVAKKAYKENLTVNP